MNRKHSACFILSVVFCFTLSSCTFIQNNTEHSVWPTKQNVFSMPTTGNDLVGNTFTVSSRYGDTLSTLGELFDVGAVEMQHANPTISSGRIKTDTQITLPTQYILPPQKYRSGIVINIAELRLYYFTKDQQVMTFPLGLGKIGWRTPLGHTYIVRKQMDPPWTVPESIRKYTFEKTGKLLPSVVPPGKDNPLGPYALYLGLSGYLIHGTNDPASVGNLVSSGCIRLYNRNVEKLYQQVPIGTIVHIIYFPNKAGWKNNNLYLETHYPIVHEKQVYEKAALSAEQVIQMAMQNRPANIDWAKVKQVINEHTGIPTIIGTAL